jgi:chromosome segregation ATPase
MPFAVAGCATRQQTSSLECGAGTAAVAYVACKLLGNSDASCARFAVVGGGVGAAACYSYAGRLEKRRQQLTGREQDLNARLQYVRGLNEDGRQLNAELRGRVNAASERVADLRSQVGGDKASAKRVANERQRLDDEIKVANQQVALQSNALSEVKTYRAQARPASLDLDSEIAKQDRLLADAQRQVAALASLRERV